MLFRLDPYNPAAPFPDIALAEREPNGLLAIGGDLSVTRLVNAYRHGIFPWFNAGDPILWWSPDPRTVFFPERLHVSRSLRKRLRRRELGVTLDRAFDAVIAACSAPRRDGAGTWLVPEMVAAYRALHRHRLAHSVEVWRGDELVGGLYGVAVGGVFFGESMFSRADDASKVALVHLCRQLADWGFGLIDCQVMSAHLVRLGADELAREDFAALLEHGCQLPGRPGLWDDGALHYPSAEAAGGATAT
ncbi:leucyl/phenylalanyl-tRNA--protein transferase [Thiococcus pfennigii]|jgi:leucyl/phenylalanyl-tRNA--protein transferase|uniref:leucyl/phenylalanyl-tRNA--protein transferase n=1 Tax=Thiococcus pfennigii TaxID=1057 RepID=UPI001905D46F|nr:leucyl/phenylalanyl-tRNA--protein transferase [Thiococcus pfennigii]MBK1702282.1 leucyl/phenylalanyl-tRNA--protein transferase [Thiococcus pfennigii]MBK1732275.1 leucyl/phenylalanyl-tRNA--protein transferase [Thiococcus pfennigii]